MTDLEKSLIERVGELEKQLATKDSQIHDLRALHEVGIKNRVGSYGPLAISVDQWTYQLRNYRILAIGALGCRNRIPTQHMVKKLRLWFDEGRRLTENDKEIPDILFFL